MGKSVELLGLLAFNVFLALVLSATFLSNPENVIQQLDESNVESFINEVSAISSGQREDMDDFSIAHYFMKHIADNSKFTSNLRYDDSFDERTMEMNKKSYISSVLQGMKSMDRHETKVNIEYIEIKNDGDTARAVTVIHERGVIPLDDGFGDVRMTPVTGVSYCDQEIILNKEKKVLQMVSANCTTDMKIVSSY